MNRYHSEVLFLGIILVGILFAAFYSSVWYISPFLIGILVYIWYISKERPEYTLVFFICGEMASAVVWYASPWLAWIIQFMVFGLFLMKEKISDTKLERYGFILLGFLLFLISLLTDQMNHTGLPILLIFVASVAIILYLFVCEFRLRKQYVGDRS